MYPRHPLPAERLMELCEACSISPSEDGGAAGDLPAAALIEGPS